MVNENIQIIGIDQGWQNIKTENDCFTTAVEERCNPTFREQVLEYDGKCYVIGGKRLEVKSSKVEDEDFYLLMLAGIARELKARGNIKEASVYLAVGLPLTRFGEERADYVSYLSKNKELMFKYGDEEYHVKLLKVFVYPQCYSAVVNRIPYFERRTVVVDIGSWTVDILPVVNKRPDETGCNSLPHGVITLVRKINKEVINGFNYEISEEDIDYYIQHHKLTNAPEKVIQLIDRHLQEYADDILRKLKEHSINVELSPLVFVGGGAKIMKDYCTMIKPNMEFILDVSANAKGYAAMTKAALRAERR
ncbi:MAG: ParM/StbA family protein [Lachnospira sp.]|nr:ParM/StbA family protein [Lachnospira sp.]